MEEGEGMGGGGGGGGRSAVERKKKRPPPPKKKPQNKQTNQKGKTDYSYTDRTGEVVSQST